MSRVTTPRRRAFLVALVVAAAGVLALPSPAAHAADFPTYGSGVNVRADATSQSAVVTTLAAAETISVDCQKRGEVVTVDGASSEWWAHVPAQGGYVTVAYVDIAESQLPGVPECGGEPPQPGGPITYDALAAMFPGDVGDRATVEAGLPGLNAEMTAAGITTVPRQAAFLATLANESRFEYDIHEEGDTRLYGGRGYIQLTGEANYTSAGADLGIDLVGNPDLAMSLDHSAPIARWYWTVARDINPLADALDMGAVDAAIGYSPDAAEDAERCVDFKAALQHLGGSVPAGIDCARPALSGGRENTMRQTEAQFAEEMLRLERIAARR